jgi:8-oxo-dGTP pyrophosphatase MutT (NUDIX family)
MSQVSPDGRHVVTMIDRRRPRHNLRMAGTWELPFGKGRKFLGNARQGDIDCIC